MPAPMITQNVTPANAAVTVSEPVGEPAHGRIPIKLQNNTKKNRFQIYGRKRSASCRPMACRATSSRTNRSIASNRFDSRPWGGSPLRSRRPKGTKISNINAATPSSTTM